MGVKEEVFHKKVFWGKLYIVTTFHYTSYFGDIFLSFFFFFFFLRVNVDLISSRPETVSTLYYIILYLQMRR